MQHYTGGNYTVGINGGYVDLGWYSSGWVGVTDTTLLAAGVWNHVAVTMDTSNPASAVVSSWINGALSSSVDSGLPANGGTANTWVVLGSNWNGSASWLYYGQMDEVRISDTIRYVVPEPSMMLLALGALAIFRKK